MSTLKKILNFILTLSFVISLYTYWKVETKLPVSQEQLKKKELVLNRAISPSPPKYPEGDQAMLEYIYQNIKLPNTSREHLNVTGSLLVLSFTVDENGIPSDYQILRSLHQDYDQAAIDVIKQIRKWEPGRDHNGVAITSTLSIPIRMCF